MSSNISTSECFGNVSNDVVALMNKSTVDLNFIYKVWQGLIPLPFAIIGCFFALIYILAVYKAIKQHRVSRKCYVLLINRAVGDVLACILVIIGAIYANSVGKVDRVWMQILDLMFFCSFYAAMVSYISLSLIKLYAVKSPLEYRRRVTMQRCIYLIALSWIVCGFMISYAITVVALTRIPALNVWSGCKIETCMRTMYRVRNVGVVFEYTLTIVCFSITVVLLKRARRFMRSFHQKSTNTISANDTNPKLKSLRERFPLWKLTLNVSTFAFFNGFYAIWAVVLLTRTDKCFFLQHFNTMMLLLGIVRISLLLRVIFDPVLAFITDIQVRRSMLAIFGLTKKVIPLDSRKRMFLFGRSDPSEENSSDTDLKNFNRISRTRPATLSTELPSRSSAKSVETEGN